MDNSNYLAVAEAPEVHGEEEQLFDRDWYNPDCYATAILDAKYKKVNTDDVVKQLTHLSTTQKEDLRNMLKDFSKIFDGTLGVYPYRKFHFDIMPGAKPKHVQPYAIARIHLEAFKKELDHLVSIRVLSPTGASKWGSPMFITTKKDGCIRWVSDLRELNKVVLRKQYALPIIQDILKKRSGYTFFTKIDILLQYYTFELDKESKDLTNIVTPFGKYRYNLLPMGLLKKPWIISSAMSKTQKSTSMILVHSQTLGNTT